MERGDYEVLKRLNGEFDKALVSLRDHHVREIQELRKLYVGARKRVRELEAEIRELNTKPERR